MNTELELKTIIKNHLDSLSEKFNKELSQILNSKRSEDSKLIFIEYDCGFFSDEFSVHLYLCDSNISALDSHDFLLDETVLPEEALDEEFEEIIDDIPSEILEAWLEEQWKNHNEKLPVYTGHHDLPTVKDLNTGKSITWSELKKGLWE